MNQSRQGLGNKRKRDSKSLNVDDGRVYNLIRSKEDMGISKKQIAIDLKMVTQKVTSCIKSLEGMKMIQEIADIQSKGMKRYLAMDIEPSKKVTGGVWYDDGKLDIELINTLKTLSLKILSDSQKVATVDGIRSVLNRVMQGRDLSVEQVEEILENLILDKKIVKVKSNGLGEFAAFPMGVDCYKKGREKMGGGAMTSSPCGVCPRINQCHPDGIISPSTCEYFTEWLLKFPKVLEF